MGARFTWNGLDEQYRDLQSLAADLARDAEELAIVAAHGSAGAIGGRYPVRSGRLNTSVHVVRYSGPPTRGGARVLASARHAMVFDLGSHGNRATASGLNRGRMPAGRVFVPQMMRARRAFLRDVKRFLPNRGLVASGDA